MRPASILLLNVESKKIIARYHQSSTNMYIQKVIFNKLSGELLVEICTKGNFCGISFMEWNVDNDMVF